MKIALMKQQALEDRFEEIYKELLDEILSTGELPFEQAEQLARELANDAVDPEEEASIRY